jgi:NAD+ synthase (glutamine-hydrolysing)
MAEFDTPFSHGFLRVAAAAPKVTPADPAANAAAIIAALERAAAAEADVLLCPELSVSGYAIDDLHMQAALLDAVERALEALRMATQGKRQLLVVGAPLRNAQRDGLYNCAVAVQAGQYLGVAAKTYLPNYREYYEKRWFCAHDPNNPQTVILGDCAFEMNGNHFVPSDLPMGQIAIEICEDLWAPCPPSTNAALDGATVILNLSASNVTIGKADLRDHLCAAQSMRALCAYVYAAAGYGESTTDLAWDGQLVAFEMGEKIAASERFHTGDALMVVDIDVARIAQERLRTPTFHDGRRLANASHGQPTRMGSLVRRFERAAPVAAPAFLMRPIDRFPFVPDNPARLDQDCFEAYSIQVQGLRRRLEAAGAKKAVIGISGGLDSTQALLVAARAFDQMGRPRSDIVGVTMPGFATGEGSKSNAWALMRSLGVDGREVDIRPLCRQMLADLNHPFARGEAVYDITFENVQAGLRTDYLFRLANHEGGLVVGTGDLSELALGWCTYGVGDHMSHYGVNAGAPKTLIQHLIRWGAASGHYGAEAAGILERIVASEISPELVPAGADGKPQSTEAAIGPYALHDFFLYYATRYGFGPRRIAYLAHCAWRARDTGAWPAHLREADRVVYDLPTIVKWLEVFVQRFYASAQFKRSAMPNGPKLVSGGALSPRGDWRAPSDSSAHAWLQEIEALKALIRG